jgi:hypothetical protein
VQNAKVVFTKVFCENPQVSGGKIKKKLSCTTMSNKKISDEAREAIIKQKEFLAEASLKVSCEAISMLEDQLPECSTRDLVQIFSASIKAHREISEDIIVLTAKEAPGEELQSREYDGKVEELLKRISNF